MNSNGKTEINGPRVYLRRLELEDATDAYCGWLNDPEVNRFLDTKSATKESIKNYIREKNQNKNVFLFGIFMRDTNRHIGTIKLDPVDFHEKKASVAVMLGDKEYWGKNLGSEAIQALVKHAFNDLGLKEIWLGLQRANVAAYKAYSKLGFVEASKASVELQFTFDPNLRNEVNMFLTEKPFF